MKSFIAALRSLVLPFGAITGARIVLDGVNGRIEVYDASNTRVGLIDNTGIWQINSDGTSVRFGPGVTPDLSPTPQIIFQPAGFTPPPAALSEMEPGAVYVFNTPDIRTHMLWEAPHFNLSGGAASDTYPQIYLTSPRYDGSAPSEIYMDAADSSGNLIVTVEGDFVVTQTVAITGAVTMAGALTVSGDAAFTTPQIRLVQQAAQALNNATNTSLIFGVGSQEIVTGNAASWHNPAGLNTRVIPDKPGIYDFRGSVIMAPSGGGAYSQLAAAFFKNGARLNGSTITRPDPTVATCSAVAFGSAFMNGTTDFVEFSAAQTNATASVQNTSGAGSLLSVFEVRQSSR